MLTFSLSDLFSQVFIKINKQTYIFELESYYRLII